SGGIHVSTDNPVVYVARAAVQQVHHWVALQWWGGVGRWQEDQELSQLAADHRAGMGSLLAGALDRRDPYRVIDRRGGAVVEDGIQVADHKHQGSDDDSD